MDKWKSAARKKQSQEETRTEKVRREKMRDQESQKREDAGARKGREVAITLCLYMSLQFFLAPEG